MRAWLAGVISLVVALVVAITVYSMTVGLALLSARSMERVSPDMRIHHRLLLRRAAGSSRRFRYAAVVLLTSIYLDVRVRRTEIERGSAS